MNEAEYKRNPLFLVFKTGLVLALTGLLFFSVSGCPGMTAPPTTPTDSTSASEVAEALVSGTVNVTSSTGSQARLMWPRKHSMKVGSLFGGSLLREIWSDLTPVPQACAQRVATVTCPTIQAGGGTNCAVSGNQMTLNYPVCNFTSQGTSTTTTWSGVQYITHKSGPTTTMTCGTFPSFNSGDVLTRTFAAGTSRETPNLLVVLLDTTGSVNGNPAVAATGLTISYSGPVARTITVNGVHVAAQLSNYVVWDYMMTSNTINVDATNSVTSGTMTLQDLQHGRTATSTLTNLTYSANCCMATGGTVSTTWSDGSPSETLTFTGTCGNATLNGNAITLTQCF